jgi:pyruvate/oxaloacetate carboxyltransferase
MEQEVKTVEQINLEKLEEMKQQMENMVSGEEYNKIKAEYEKLLNEYINKRPAPKEEIVKPRNPREIINDINNAKLNRDYISKVLEYRDAVLQETGKDVFADVSTTGLGNPTPDTEEVANALQSLLESTDSPAEFNFRLEQMLVDDAAVIASIKANKNKK